MQAIMKKAGKYIRHGAAWLIGLLVGFIAATFGVEVTDGQTFALTEGLTALGLIIIGIGYSYAEKWLKRFRWLDPEAWVERIWAKEAASTTAHTSTDVASERIRSGSV